MGSWLLLLLVGLLLISEWLHCWLGLQRPHCDRPDGLERRSALWDWCIDGRVRRGHHVASLGAGGSQAPLGTVCGTVLTRGLLEGGVPSR
jgi:hypothetical protein